MHKMSKYIIGGILIVFVFLLSVHITTIIQNRRLFVAIEEQDKEAVSKAINRGANVNSTKYKWAIQEIVWYNPTPLITACKEGNIDIIDILLEHGADINKSDPWVGQTPLEYVLASKNKNRFEIAMHLIEKGAEYDCFSGSYTAIERSIAIYESDTDETIQQGYALFEFLIQNQESTESPYGVHTLLTYACSNDNERVVEYLIINQYANVDEKNKAGMTGLMVAARYNAKKTCEKLLEHGADVKAIDNSGKTAFDYAVQSGNKDIIALLEN